MCPILLATFKRLDEPVAVDRALLEALAGPEELFVDFNERGVVLGFVHSASVLASTIAIYKA